MLLNSMIGDESTMGGSDLFHGLPSTMVRYRECAGTISNLERVPYSIASVIDDHRPAILPSMDQSEG